jgi:hypothetical protein
MTNRSYNISFAQGSTSPTAINDWFTAGTNTAAQLFAYDSGRYYVNHLETLVENGVAAGTETLAYLGKAGETMNLLKFETATIVIQVEAQLNNFYRLSHIIVRNETNSASAGPDFLERFVPSSVNGNQYTFEINKILRVESVSTAFIFGLEHRQNVLDGTVQEELTFNPLETQMIKLTLHGSSVSNNVYDISGSGSIEHREYRKRLYIRDADNEIGFLAYDKILEKYSFTEGADTYTVYRFNIVDSVLHNVTISGTDLNNNTLVKNLVIKKGIVQLKFNITTPGYTIDFAEVELAAATLASVPDGNPKLTITRSVAAPS